MGIRKKLILVSMAVILSTMSLMGLLSYQLAADNAQAQIERYHQLSLRGMAQQLDSFIESVNASYFHLITNQAVQEFLYKTSEDSVWNRVFFEDRVRQELLNHVTTISCLHSAAVLRADGEVVATSNLSSYLRASMVDAWLDNLETGGAGNAWFGQPQRLKTATSDYVFPFVRKVFSMANGRDVSGYVLLNIHYEQLADLFEPLTEQFDEISLTDAADQTFYRFQRAAPAEDARLRKDYAFPLGNYPLTLRALNLNNALADALAGLRVKILGIMLLAVLVAALLLTPTLSHMMQPIAELSRAIDQIASDRTDVRVDIRTRDELQVLGDGLNSMVTRLKEYSENEKAYRENEMNMEYGLLLAQINPHFIYNVLNSVKYLAVGGQTRQVEQVINSLISLLQDSVRMGENRVFTQLGTELTITRYYCDIQSIVYPDAFTLETQIDPQALTLSVPKTILQPLVENAIVHGLLPSLRRGRVVVRAAVERDRLLLQVADDGVGMDDAELEKLMDNASQPAQNMRQIGVANIMKRLRHIYGEEAAVTVASRPGHGTTVSLSLPVGR